MACDELIDMADVVRGAGMTLIDIADDETKFKAAHTTHIELLRTVMKGIEALELALDPSLRDH